ncbi:MAG TPA: hypothetical protein VNM92_12130 [Thermoanaerobaculia bacterium]|nr:hypothetical protein [Thermoanaerobaculia bacterium]
MPTLIVCRNRCDEWLFGPKVVPSFAKTTSISASSIVMKSRKFRSSRSVFSTRMVRTSERERMYAKSASKPGRPVVLAVSSSLNSATIWNPAAAACCTRNRRCASME